MFVIFVEFVPQGNDPVLNHEQYESAVNRELQSKYGLRFRDGAELNQVPKAVPLVIQQPSEYRTPKYWIHRNTGLFSVLY